MEIQQQDDNFGPHPNLNVNNHNGITDFTLPAHNMQNLHLLAEQQQQLVQNVNLVDACMGSSQAAVANDGNVAMDIEEDAV